MDRAMSASLASARMKSLQPCGSAWMRASLASRDFCTMTGTPCSANNAPATPLARRDPVGEESREPQREGQHRLGGDEELRHLREQQREACQENGREDALDEDPHVAEEPAE